MSQEFLANLLTLASVIGALTLIWAFKPTRWLVHRMAVAFVQPFQEHWEDTIRRVVREELNRGLVPVEEMLEEMNGGTHED